VLWLAAGLHWYGEQQGRDGFLSFEELAEGLVTLARRRGTTGEGGSTAERLQDQAVLGAGQGQYKMPEGMQQQQEGQGYYGAPYTTPPPQMGPFIDPFYGPQFGAGGAGPSWSDPRMIGREGSSLPGVGWSSAGDMSGLSHQQQLIPPRGGGMEAGAAYFAWVQDNRQKVLER
jgi:hypothetical protein